MKRQMTIENDLYADRLIERLGHLNHPTPNIINIEYDLLNIQSSVRAINYQCNTSFKCGRGGSHIWISDEHNQRHAIIEYKY